MWLNIFSYLSALTQHSTTCANLCPLFSEDPIWSILTTSRSPLNDDKGGKRWEVKQGRLMDCVSIQQREFPACRAGVLGSGDHLVGHQGLASLTPLVRTTSSRKQRSMGGLLPVYPLYKLSRGIFCPYCKKTSKSFEIWLYDWIKLGSPHSFLCTDVNILKILKCLSVVDGCTVSIWDGCNFVLFSVVDVVRFSEWIKWRSNHHEDDPR